MEKRYNPVEKIPPEVTTMLSHARRVHPAIAAEVISDDYASTISLLEPRAPDHFRCFRGTQCPGDVKTIRYHSVGHSQIAVSVTINRTGPYEFLVDTGSQVTVIEPSLAAELRLESQGDIEVSSLGNHSKTELVGPELVEVGPFAVHQPLVIVESLPQIQALDPKIRGLLGGSFLGHFDLLIDYAHKLLCLDETKQMRQNLQGEHVAIIQQTDGLQNLPFPHRLLISTHIQGEDSRDVLLMLDSESNVPLLYTNNLKTPAWLLKDRTHMGSVAGTDLSRPDGTSIRRNPDWLSRARGGVLRSSQYGAQSDRCGRRWIAADCSFQASLHQLLQSFRDF